MERSSKDYDENRLLTGVLGDAPLSIERVGRTAQARVYRVRTEHPPFGRDDSFTVRQAMVENGERSTWIIKLVNQPDRVAREVETYRYVVSKLDIRSPRVIGHALTESFAWLSYTDDQLVPVVRTLNRYRQALATAAQLHCLPVPSVWPKATSSHTPPFVVVQEHVRATDVDKYRAVLEQNGFAPSVIRTLQDTMDTCTHSPLNPIFDEVSVCHGDAHLGNWMWSPLDGEVYLIDWEYVHLDSPYFDLFQCLDATSPTTALVRVLPRCSALKIYYDARASAQLAAGRRLDGDVSFSAFAKGYITYAANYLWWIISLVSQDMVKLRFPEPQLRRQLNETVTGIVQLRRDWTKLS